MIQIGLNLEGIGATLQWDDGYTVVKRIVKGSPAEKQGELKEEDKIVGVGQGEDGPIEDVVDMKLTDVVDKIRGKKILLVDDVMTSGATFDELARVLRRAGATEIYGVVFCRVVRAN